ncbi:MAG TPA: ATP-binding cassette domain-containing protein [Cyclobacteriaceae bacterium]|nr:ATP-binding cassette domain-containing protein [Cyclobacteriaceae bacterium]
MSPSVIRTNDLEFSFTKQAKILHGLNLDVHQGSIYGFLGPNGAGKTTTLKLLLGLLNNNNNLITIFGEDFAKNRLALLRKIGSLIEQPSLYGHLTGTENLEVFRLAYNCKRERIGEVLKIVGLSQAANKKAKAYSLGMKQRLAIAIALLHDPELLILDEPTNGLDPTGIIEIRDLIVQLNKEFNKTILISSHLLNEVEKMASHVGIIHHGRLMFQGELTELQQMKSSFTTLEVEVDDIENVKLLVNDRPIKQVGAFTLHINIENRESAAALNSMLVQNQIKVYKLGFVHTDLEELFVEMISIRW